MKTLLFLSILTFSLSSIDLKRQYEIVEKVNNMNTSWKAKVYPRDINSLIGVISNPSLPLKESFSDISNELPESYDPRILHPECPSFKEIRDQSRCGSCWAFGATEVMTDRICLHSKGKLQTRVSALHLISCCGPCGFGCRGGTPAEAFLWWKNKGIPSGGSYGDKSTCKPYFLPECDDHLTKCCDYAKTPKCEEKCINEYPKKLEEDLTFGKNVYSIKGERNIMREIYENGPVEGIFIIYEDFAVYSSGIYQHVTGSPVGVHAVKILGWGVSEDGIKFWLIANSWNNRWGEGGFFRMIRGKDDCGIEGSAVAGVPKLE